MFGFKKNNSEIDWQFLNSVDQLKVLIEQSIDLPVVLFKHSTTCSISATALGRFERSYDKKMTGKAHFYLLDILNHRDISKEVAEHFGVQHESPQLLIIQSGICVFSESHFDISYNDVVTQLVGN